jgi:maltose O-acetyltransferase
MFMPGRSILLQLVNKLFDFKPLTRWYRLRTRLLRIAGVDCHPTARIVASATIMSVNIAIGEDTFIGCEALVGGNNSVRISIGNNVDIAPRAVIYSGTHEIDMHGEHSAGKTIGKEIVIHDGAWIGASSTVLAGVTIGRKAIIGAGSVVCRDIPEYAIAVGNPCRPIKKWDSLQGKFVPFGSTLAGDERPTQ